MGFLFGITNNHKIKKCLRMVTLRDKAWSGPISTSYPSEFSCWHCKNRIQVYMAHVGKQIIILNPSTCIYIYTYIYYCMCIYIYTYIHISTYNSIQYKYIFYVSLDFQAVHAAITTPFQFFFAPLAVLLAAERPSSKPDQCWMSGFSRTFAGKHGKTMENHGKPWKTHRIYLGRTMDWPSFCVFFSNHLTKKILLPAPRPRNST